MNKLTYQDFPELFDSIAEDYDPVESDRQHRRGSTFYVTDIIEINEDWLHWVPTLKPEHYGFWRTNTYMWSDDYGKDEGVSELTRVERKEKVITIYEYITVKD